LAASALIALLLVVGLGTVLLRNQQLARRQLELRFHTRGEIAAQFISRYLADLAQKEAAVASQRLSDTAANPESFVLIVDSFGFEAAVLLDSKGFLLNVAPFKQEIIGTELASKYRHLSQALKGRVAVSGIVPSAARGVPIIAVATPFDTPSGTRVFSGAFEVGRSPLEAFLKNIVPLKVSDAYLIDEAELVAASTARKTPKLSSLATINSPLSRAIKRSPEGAFSRGKDLHQYSVQRVSGTPLRLVVTAAQKPLLAPAEGPTRTSWLVLGALVAVSVGTLNLLWGMWNHQTAMATQRRRLDATLEEEHRLNEALDEFANRAAHDLRSPVASIVSAIEMAESESSDSSEVNEWLALAKGQAFRSLELVDGLLELAKASGTPRPEPIDMAKLVEEIASMDDTAVVKHTDLPMITGDPLSIRQALTNLFQNAGRYAASDGPAQVEVSMQRRDGQWVITVEDNGPGLDPEDAESIFQAFKRGSGQKGPGTGLGLAIVAKTAEAHGGRAWYEPNPTGGSRFLFSIPA